MWYLCLVSGQEALYLPVSVEKMESLETESLMLSTWLYASTNSKCSATKGGAKPGEHWSAFARWSWLKEFQGLKSHTEVATSRLDQQATAKVSLAN